MINVTKTDVWCGPIEDRPGGVASAIEDLVLRGELDLEFLAAHGQSDGSRTGVLFLLPIGGERQQAHAQRAGLAKSAQLIGLRVTGNDEPGIAYRILKALANRGLNLRAVSVATLLHQFVMHLAFDSCDDSDVVVKTIMSAV